MTSFFEMEDVSAAAERDLIPPAFQLVSQAVKVEVRNIYDFSTITNFAATTLSRTLSYNLSPQ